MGIMMAVSFLWFEANIKQQGEAMKQAILVGINQYKNIALDYAVNDAESLAATLSMQEFDFQCSLLKDDEATASNIRKAIIEAKSMPSDMLLFYFAGHGCVAEDIAYLLSVDTERFNLGISFDEISRLLFSAHTGAKQTIAILDCCRAGNINLRSDGSGTSNFVRSLTNSDLQAQLSRSGRNKIIFAACDGTDVAIEDPELSHGAFTAALLSGFWGGAVNNKGEITIHSLCEYVINYFINNNWTQKPVFKGEWQDHIILGTNLSDIKRDNIINENIDIILNNARSALSEFEVVYADRIRNNRDFAESGYVECSSLLRTCKLLLDKIESRDKNHEQIKEAALLYGEYINELKKLGSPNIGCRTNAGTLMENLGFGKFGSVWRVQDEQKREYAFKIFHASDLEDREKIRRFKRGYNAMEKLDHKHIVKARHLEECPLGILMDFIPGPNLKQYSAAIEDKLQRLKIMIMIAETIQHAHNRGVIHRDLKPENIILFTEEDGESIKPFLTDFDLAWYSSATMIMTSQAYGTFQYSAPEQLRDPKGAPAHRQQVDAYSFAMVLYYMFINRDPQSMNFQHNEKSFEAYLKKNNEFWNATAARSFLELYKICSDENSDRRLSDFREIIERLHEIVEQTENKSSRTYSWEGFCEELKYKCTGLFSLEDSKNQSFRTASGRTRIGFEFADRKIKLDIYSMETPVMQGMDHKGMIMTLNKRIDAALSEFAGDCTRKAGNVSPFQCFITVPTRELTTENLNRMRRIISVIVDSVERTN